MPEEIKVVEDITQLVVDLQKQHSESVKSDCLGVYQDGFTEIKKNLEAYTRQLEAMEASNKNQADSIEKMQAYMARSGTGAENDAEKMVDRIREANAEMLSVDATQVGIMKNHADFDKEAVEYAQKAAIAEAFPHMSIKQVDNLYSRSIETKTYLNGDAGAGGMFIDPDRSSNLVKRIFETSPMLNDANVVNTLSNEYVVGIDDEDFNDFQDHGELMNRTNQVTPRYKKIKIPVNEMSGNVPISIQHLEDMTVDVEGIVVEKGGDKMRRQLNRQAIVGTGSDQMKGILTYGEAANPDFYEFEKVGYVNSGTAGEYKADTLLKLSLSLKEDYLPNSKFYIRRQDFWNVVTLKGTDDHYLLDPTLLFKGTTKQLLGYPVEFATDLQATANDSKSILFGDMRQAYQIVRRVGVTMLRDPYTQYDDGLVVVKLRARFGGAMVNFDAIKGYKLSA